MSSLLEQLAEVQKKYPSLSLSDDSEGYTLEGQLTLDKTYNEVPLYDTYDVQIQVKKDFPHSIPQVRDITRKVPKEFSHFYDNGALCLGARCDLISFLEKNYSLTAFIEEIVMSYLYSVTYFIEYNCYPFGERKHGVEGIREAFQERYNVYDDYLLERLLLCLINQKECRGHRPCPCGSGRKFRDCHGKRVIEDAKSDYSNEYRLDACEVLKLIIKELKRRK